MFNLIRRQEPSLPKQYGVRASYKPLAVSPEAHSIIKKMANENGRTIVSTVDELVGV